MNRGARRPPPEESSATISLGMLAGFARDLRFLAAAELIESDLWQQYNELGGVKGGNAAYMAAIEKKLGKAYAEPAGDVRGYIAYVKSQASAQS